ncbi:MAG TPA: trans-aconitate 2-methyltransferase [Roseiarcus sp.]|jgi:trans-aconitate 2-methyltransferase
MTWSAAQYLKFEHERTRPVRDLLARIPLAQVETAADIGCGPANSTEVLRERYPSARIIGLDSSADMIQAARERLPDTTFEVADIREWRPKEPLDVILANAVFQWIPDHETLFPALIAKLKPGGALAAQMPDNLEQPSHRLMGEVASDGPWAAKLKDAAAARTERHLADWYFRLARPHAPYVDIWRTTYFHPLAGAGAIVEWLKGTGLRPFLDPLDESERQAFLARYEGRIAKAYPAEPDGTVLLPFPRLFVVAAR